MVSEILDPLEPDNPYAGLDYSQSAEVIAALIEARKRALPEYSGLLEIRGLSMKFLLLKT